MKYVCTEGFCVEMYDDDGFSTDRYIDVEVGEEYETDDSDFRLVGSKDSIRLESKNGNWLELTPDYVSRFFSPVWRKQE